MELEDVHAFPAADEESIVEAPEVSVLRAELAEREALIATQRETEGRLLERVRLALLASEPDIDPELVTGKSLEEVEASFAAAQGQVARLRERFERKSAVVVPAGAPGRAVAVPGSAFEKIRAGLAEQ